MDQTSFLFLNNRFVLKMTTKRKTKLSFRFKNKEEKNKNETNIFKNGRFWKQPFLNDPWLCEQVGSVV